MLPQLPPPKKLKRKRAANSVRSLFLAFRMRLTVTRAVTMIAVLLVQDLRFFPRVTLAGRGGDQNRGGKQAESIHRGPV